MIDECVDVAVREQLVIVIRFITPDGRAAECFLKILTVPDGKGVISICMPPFSEFAFCFF